MLEYAKMSFSLLDSLDSDTDTLVREKAYQLELQKRIGSNVNIQIEENGSDSLEKTPVTIVDHRTTRTDEEVTSDDSDEYADLRYDPDWRRNFKEVPLFHDLRTQLSLEHGVHDGYDGPEEDLRQVRSLTKRRGHEKVNAIGHRVVRSGGPIEDYVTVEKISGVQLDLPASSFHLHPPEDQVVACDTSTTSSQTQSPPASAEMAAGRLNHALKETSLARPQRRHHRAIPEGHDQTREPPEQGEEAPGRVNDSHGAFPLHQKSSSHRRSNARPAKPRGDVVDQNKKTLGVNPSKQGSYLRMYGKKRDPPEQTHEVQDSPEDSSTDSQESQEEDESLNTEHLWHQKTQRLRVTQCQGERKLQPKGGNGRPLRQNRPKRTHAAQTQTRSRFTPPTDGPLLAGGDSQQPRADILVIDDDARSSSYASDTSPAPRPRPPHRRSPPPPAPLSSSSRTPTVNLNINLNTSNTARGLSPHVSREQQDSLLALAPPQAPQWMLRPPPFFPPAPFTGSDSGPGLLPSPHAAATADAGQLQWALVMASPRGVIPDSGHKGLDTLAPPGGRKRNSTGAHFWGQSQNGERVSLWQSNTAPTPEPVVKMHDHALRSRHSIGSPAPIFVLPPIGRTVVEQDREHMADRAQNSLMTIGPRSCSDGYLAQMEKQRQTKAQTAYKAYTLKDYKSLEQDVKLGGLGPSSAVTETTAEKIRRQKLYSDVIRQQNKKISRIPFLPAQAQAQTQAPLNTNKDLAPRRKALEYARTIAKPSVSSPRLKKEAQGMKAVPDQARYLSGVDVGQLTLLESLRRRHELEKQAVAQFKAVQAV